MNKKESKLSKKAIFEIKKARERIKRGYFYTEQEAKNIIYCN